MIPPEVPSTIGGLITSLSGLLASRQFSFIRAHDVFAGVCTTLLERCTFVYLAVLIWAASEIFIFMSVGCLVDSTTAGYVFSMFAAGVVFFRKLANGLQQVEVVFDRTVRITLVRAPMSLCLFAPWSAPPRATFPAP